MTATARRLPRRIRTTILPDRDWCGVNLGSLRAHCLAKPGATEGRPFGPEVLVMKVGEKVFAIIGDDSEPLTLSLKCEPEVAVLLRQSYEAVGPGYHLNKRHWNTVTLDGTVAVNDVLDWVDDSYDLVVDGLPRREREALRDAGK